MGQDRTDEFMRLARTVPEASTNSIVGGTAVGKGGPGGAAKAVVVQQAASKPSAVPSIPSSSGGGSYGDLRTFHSVASSISSDIAKTSALLSELAQLVRKRNLFVDDTERVNGLVMTIKTNIEQLNRRLDEAASASAARKRGLGRNSQAGQEATNLVDQLREEFARATRGFKVVLQQRSDGMKEAEHRKMAVFGQAAAPGGPAAHQGHHRPSGPGGPPDGSMALGSRPPVYGGLAHPSDPNANNPLAPPAGGLNLGNPPPASLGGPIGGTFGAPGAAGGLRSHVMVPTLDLTSAYSNPANIDAMPPPAGESTSSALPRPHGVYSDGVGHPGSYTPNGLRARSNASSAAAAAAAASSGSMISNSAGPNPGTYYAGNTAGGPPPYGSPPPPGAGNPYQPLTPVEIQRMEEQSGSSRMMQLIPDQNYLRDRADAMSTVESNIVELGTIFNKLAVMVSEHRELVERVEDNVDNSASNINLSMAALVDTLDNLRTNRALFAKVLGILLVFIVLFVTFFA